MNRLLASTALAALALFSGARPADAREILNPNRQVCKADGRRIPCRYVFKCRIAGGDDLRREGQRWFCCDAFVGSGNGLCRGVCEPPVPLPEEQVRCFDLVREDGFPTLPTPPAGSVPDFDDPPIAIAR